MKKIVAVVMASLLAFSLVGCAGTKANSVNETKENVKQEETKTQEKADNQSDKKTDDKITLNVAYMPNYASLWSVLTGIDKGYFAEEGLNIKLIEFADGPSEIAAMEGGSVDIAYIGHGAHKLCIEGRADIIVPSSVHSDDKIIVLKSHGIEKLEDLKGKKVAYNAGSSSETALTKALDVAGLTMNDIQPYEMDATNMVAAMLSGSVDACASWNPYDQQIIDNDKDAQFIKFANDSVNLSSWITLPKYVENNKDVVLRFTRALYKSMQFASQKENWDYVVDLYAKQTGKDVEACKVETGDATWFSADDIKNGLDDGTIKKYYEKQQQMFIDAGKVEKAVPVENYVEFDIMKEALNNK